MATRCHLSSVISVLPDASIDNRIEHSGAQTVNQSISATHEYLLTHYGPLLTIKHLAEVMHASPNGVRMAIARKRQPLAVALSNARRQLGRRVYFEARLVADVIDQGMTGKPLKERPTETGASLQSPERSLICTQP
jgi:hypothetical protein